MTSLGPVALEDGEAILVNPKREITDAAALKIYQELQDPKTWWHDPYDPEYLIYKDNLGQEVTEIKLSVSGIQWSRLYILREPHYLYVWKGNPRETKFFRDLPPDEQERIYNYVREEGKTTGKEE